MGPVKPTARAKLGTTVKPGRRLGLTALENGIMYRERLYGSMQFGYCLELSGPELTKRQIQDAWLLTQAVHPLLRCKTVQKKKGKFELREEESFEVDIEVVHGRSVQDIWHEYHTKPIELEKPAAITKFIIAHPGTPEQEGGAFTLIIVFNHAFSDGISASRYVDMFFSVLEGGKERLGEPLGFAQPYYALVREKLKKLSRREYLATFKTFISWAMFGEECAYFPRDDTSITYKTIAAKSYCSNLIGSLSKEETGKLLKLCKERSLTVGAVCSSAFMLAMKRVMVEHDDYNNISLAIVSSARHEYLPGKLRDEEFGFHVSGLKPVYASTLNVKYDGPANGQDVWQCAEGVKEYMEKRVVKMHSLAALSFIHHYFKSLVHPFKSYETIAVSNWGRLPIQDSYGVWKVETAYPVSSFNNMIMPTCLVSTAVGSLSINVGVGIPAVKLEAAQALLDECLRLLKDSIKE